MKHYYDPKRITSETEFTLMDEHDYFNDDAYVDPKLNMMTIGRKCLTLETIIHELNELEIIEILKNMGYSNPRITLKIKNNNKHFKNILNIPLEDLIMDKIHINYLSHFMSPYGTASLIQPYFNGKKEETLI
jgi:hypothetical protein